MDTDYRFRSLTFLSQEDGSFAIKGVPPGEHVFSVISSGTDQAEYAGRNVVVKVVDVGKTLHTRITVEKSYPLVVRAIDADTQAALPHVRVFISDEAYPGQRDIFSKLATTDSNGLARLIVPLGQYTINAMSETHNNGFNENSGTKVNILSVPAAPMDIPIPMRVPPVRGIVYDPNGNPVIGASVNIGLGEKVITDGNGTFQGNQNSLYPAHLVTVQDKGASLVGAKSFYDASQELKIRLKPGSTIQGTVRDRNGLGIVGANVRLDLNNVLRGGRRDIHGQAEMMTVRTDPNGCYRFDGVFPLRTGFSYRVTVDAVGYGTETFAIDQKMKSGEVVTPENLIMLQTDASISGTVVDNQGHPVLYADVHASQALGLRVFKGTTTDEKGKFRINRLVKGPLSLWVDYRQGNEKAFLDAHTGDHVTIRLGEAKAYVSHLSLVGQMLPDLGSLEMGYNAPHIKNKFTLVCFVDYTERPSLDSIRFLQKQSGLLRQNRVGIVCILVNGMSDVDFEAWKKKNRITFPIYSLPERYFDGYETKPQLLKTKPDYAKLLMKTWGVRSIPWTILCDEDQKIIATGFHIARVLTYTQPAMDLYSPGTPNRRR